MGKEIYNITAHWPYRQESLPVLANRVASLFECLANIDPIFARWGNFQEKAGHIMTPEAVLQTQIEQRVRHSDNTFLNYANDGYFFLFLNSAVPGDWVDILVICGTNSNEHPIFNRVTVSIRPEGNAARLLTTQTLAKIVRCMAHTMQPEWISAAPERLIYMKSQRPKRHAHVGWITYLANPSQPLPTFSAPSHSALYTQGILITATDEPFVRQNSEHMAIINAIDAALVGAGIFDPGTFTDMEELANTAGVRMITLTNSARVEIDFSVEPYGNIFPMPPGAEFKVANYDDEQLNIEEQYGLDGGHITINSEWQMLEVYYNGVMLFGSWEY